MFRVLLYVKLFMRWLWYAKLFMRWLLYVKFFCAWVHQDSVGINLKIFTMIASLMSSLTEALHYVRLVLREVW